MLGRAWTARGTSRRDSTSARCGCWSTASARPTSRPTGTGWGSRGPLPEVSGSYLGRKRKRDLLEFLFHFWPVLISFEGRMKLLNHCGPRVLVKKCPLQHMSSFSSVLTQIRKGFLVMKEGSNPRPLGHEAFRLPSVYSRLQ